MSKRTRRGIAVGLIFWAMTGAAGDMAFAGPAGIPSGGSPLTGTAFNITYGSGLTGNQDARDAFERAGERWSAVLRDPVTISIAVDYLPLGSGILGQATVAKVTHNYDTIRDMLAGGGDSGSWQEAALLPNLPTAVQLSVDLPDGFAVSGNCELTKPNYRALGGASIGSDGAVTFSSDFAWDFNPGDGVDEGTYDFEGAAVHEIGHIIGFISSVGGVDNMLNSGVASDNIRMTPLDLFRFHTEDLGEGFDFTFAPRNLTPGGSHSFYYGDGSVLMATGKYNGDGRHPSHWKDDLSLGIMDPTAATGERLVITRNDLIAMDLIGWNVVPEPASAMLLLIGLPWIVRRRIGKRRRR